MRTKILLVILFAAALIFAGALFLRTGAAQAFGIFPLVVFGAALADSVNPCAFSVLLVTIAFLMSAGQLRSRILFVGGAYIFGIFLAYILIGLGILRALAFFGVPHVLSGIAAALFILLGIIRLCAVWFPSFPLRFGIPKAAHRYIAELMARNSLPAAFFIGALVGITEFPCTGGPYLFVLGLLHDSATFLQGLGYLVFYNIVFVLPLALVLFVAANAALLEKARSWKQEHIRSASIVEGVAMIALGLVIFFL